jgi:hypothetical protein
MKAPVWDDCCARADDAGEATKNRMQAKESRTCIAQLAEKKPDSTLECQFTKTGDHTNYPGRNTDLKLGSRSMSVMAI